MKISRLCLKLAGRGLLKKLYFHQMFWFNVWWQLVTWPYQLIWIRFHFGRIVCSNDVIWSKNCPKFHYFETFAGAGARHEWLRWLKPCQFQRTVFLHCECDKRSPDARLLLLAVCCSWTRGHKSKWALSHQASTSKYGSVNQLWKWLENF